MYFNLLKNANTGKMYPRIAKMYTSTAHNAPDIWNVSLLITYDLSLDIAYRYFNVRNELKY